MNKNRRLLMLSGLGISVSALIPLLAKAQDKPVADALKLTGTTVVELANFSCSRCNAVNAHFPRLQRSAMNAGIDLVFAPVTWEEQSLWPDRIYYAMRDLYPITEALVRDAIFDGIHREGQGFESASQVIAYLEREGVPEAALKIEPKFDLAAVSDKANSNDPLYAEIKAGRLLDLSGAQEVPVFAWIGGGKITKVISPADAPDPGALVSLVNKTLTGAEF